MAKRGQGEGSISKRPDGTWCARISVGYNANGKRKRKAFYGKTRKEVQEKMTAALNEINQGNYIEPSDMTMSEWMDIYLTEYDKPRLKPSTYYSHCHITKNHIKPMIGHYKISQLRNDILQKFVNDLRKKDNISPEYIEKIYNVVAPAVRKAMSNNLIRPFNTRVSLPEKTKAEERRVFTQEEQDIFVQKVKGTYYGDFLIVALGTGARVGELAALSWDDIDFEKQCMRINKTVTIVRDYYDKIFAPGTTYGITTPKTKSSIRIIPLLPEVVSILRRLKETQEQQREIVGTAWNETNLVFTNYIGAPINTRYVATKMRSVLDEMGIAGMTPHCLRHTFATRCLENGVELKVVQELLGHSSLSMTADLYTHVLLEKKTESIEKLNGTIRL